MSTGFEIFIGFLSFIITCALVWGQYRNGKGIAAQRAAQDANDTVSLLKTRADTFEAQLKDAIAQLTAQHDEIIRLQEANKHKDALIEQYMSIITNRNPDLEKTLVESATFSRR